MNEVEYLENVNLFVLHTITIDELATVTSPIPRIPSSSPFFVASQEKRRKKMFTWTSGRNMCKRNSPVFMKTETSLISCQAQVGPTPHSGIFKKKNNLLRHPIRLWSSCAQEEKAAKKALLALGAWQLHLVPGNCNCSCTLCLLQKKGGRMCRQEVMYSPSLQLAPP